MHRAEQVHQLQGPQDCRGGEGDHRDRRLARQEGASALVGRKAADDPQGQRRAGVGRQYGVITGRRRWRLPFSVPISPGTPGSGLGRTCRPS